MVAWHIVFSGGSAGDLRLAAMSVIVAGVGSNIGQASYATGQTISVNGGESMG